MRKLRKLHISELRSMINEEVKLLKEESTIMSVVNDVDDYLVRMLAGGDNGRIRELKYDFNRMISTTAPYVDDSPMRDVGSGFIYDYHLRTSDTQKLIDIIVKKHKLVRAIDLAQFFDELGKQLISKHVGQQQAGQQTNRALLATNALLHSLGSFIKTTLKEKNI